MDLLIKGGRVIDPAQQIDEKLDIRIGDGTIKELGKKLAAGKSCQVIDANGLVVTPGLIDMHVHLRDPGLEYKEDIVTGTRAAAAGGFTSVACMPNTKPVNDNKTVTSYILDKAKAEGLVNVFPVGAITQGSKGEALAEMGELKEAGCVAVSDDGHPVANAELMRRALEYAKGMGIMVISHAEELALVGEGVMNEGFVATELGLKGIPWVAEDVATARDVYLAEFTNSPIHIAHVSTKGAVRIIRDAKARGVKVTCETAPHYFTLTDDAVRGYETNAKMNPPLREADDVAAIKEGLADGTIDAIATDHAPHHLDEKDVEFNLALNGIIGLETSCLFPWRWLRTGPRPEDPGRENVAATRRKSSALTGAPSTGGSGGHYGHRSGPGVDGDCGEARQQVEELSLARRDHEGTGCVHHCRREGCSVITSKFVGTPDYCAPNRNIPNSREIYMKAVLALADGRIFEGKSFGATGEATGEVVFNTAMTGYQEVLTDPSYKGQMVTMTYTQIGNTGINPEDIESSQLYLSGFIVKEYLDCYSNWRATMSLDAYLKENGVVGIQGLDTRALTRHLRDSGAQNGIISTVDFDHESLVEKARTVPSMAGLDLASGVTCDNPYHWTEGLWDLDSGYPEVDPEDLKYKVVAYDFGIKFNILRCLVSAGCDVTVVPATFPAEEALAMKPDGIFLSNGPGDPEPMTAGHRKHPKVGRQNADLRHLSRPPAPRARPGRPNHEAQVRQSWLQPAGHGPGNPQGGNHRPEPRLLRRSSLRLPMPANWPTRTSTTRPSKGCATRSSRSFRCSTIPRHHPVPMIRTTCSAGSWR